MKGLPYNVKVLLQKARESALLAVETYNRPTASFRSGAYIVLMVIAWTSLFHAIFLRKRVRPYYRKQTSRRFQKVDGEYRWWELDECLHQYYGSDNPPVRKNLEFFANLRNKIEHRILPRLDSEIFGECQAMLVNFESLLCEQFGERYSIKTGLSFALQVSPPPLKSAAVASSSPENREFRRVKEFIDSYRSTISADVQSDLSYSFKVFLVPKIGTHASKDAIAVEFVKYDPSKPEEMKEYEKVVALIKLKHVPVANLGLLRPSDVVREVSAAIGKPFKMHRHVLCYRHFSVRPPKGAAEPAACDTTFCVYDSAHNDYLYTKNWVEHLVKQLSDTSTYEFLFRKRKTNPETGSS